MEIGASESTKNKRILVVEDEVVVGENLRDLLKAEGYDVPEVCVSGEEAIEKVEKSVPHLLLMDIRLKGKLDGIESVIEAEKRKQNQFAVVFLTAHSQSQFPHLAQVKSRYSFLTKPYSSNALLNTIKRLLQQTSD